MKSSLFIFFWLLANLFRTYDIHLFFETFFGTAKKGKRKLPFYVFFYLLVSAEYFFFDIPIVTLILNILCAARLTFFYNADIKKRLLGLVYLFGLLCTCEAVSVFLCGFISFSWLGRGGFSSIPGVISIPIFPFIFILLYRTHKKSKNEVRIPLTYCIMAVSVPALCTYIILLSFAIEGIRAWQSVSIVAVMFAVMISVFWLYEKQTEVFTEDNRRKVLEVQNTYYQKQLEYLLLTEHSTRSLRHDMKNHLLALSALAEENNALEVTEYIDHLNRLLSPVKGNLSSGNVVIDSILNGKLALAADKGIDMKVDLAVPEKLSIDDIDITILLGNLLDNAVENFDETAGEPVRFSLHYDKGRLLIHCENPYAGTRKRSGASYDTMKEDKGNHGIGLQNVNNVINKYNGELKIREENNIFYADCLLYLVH